MAEDVAWHDTPQVPEEINWNDKPQQGKGITRVVITGQPDEPKPGVASASKPGMAETFGRAAAQGATFNLADELAGVHAAAPKIPGTDWNFPDFVGPVPLRTLLGGGRLAANYFTERDSEAVPNYEKARDEFRTALKAGAEENPVTAVAGNVAGALGSAALLPGSAATLPARIGLNALTGAGAGALSGAGEGETPQERATGALKGGAIGGAVGGVAPAVIAGAGKVLGPVASKVADVVRSIRDPEAEAARRAALAIQRDMTVAPVDRLTGAEIAQTPSAMTMDLGGETTRALARSAANQSPEGRAVLNQAIGDRFEGQTGRINQWFNENFHYPNADAQAAALKATAKTVNKPNYAKAYNEGSNLPWDETFEQISQAPEVQSAIRKAMVNAKSEAAKMGFTPPKNPFYFNAEGRLKLKTEGDQTMTPNLKFWDIVKRNLDRGDASSQQWARILRNVLDEHVPSYQTARQGAARFFGAENALEAGQNYVSRNMSAYEARTALAKMSEQERQLFQDGFVSKYMGMLNEVNDRRSILNKIAESPAAREKLNIALGPERAAQLDTKLRVENIMDFARKAVGGNSTTVRQLAELGLAGSAGYGLSGGRINPFDSPGAVITSLLSMGAAKGHIAINANVSRKIADLLVSRNPADLQRGVDIIRKNQNLMSALHSADKYIARVAGEAGSGRPKASQED